MVFVVAEKKVLDIYIYFYLERERPLANLGACNLSIYLSLCVCDVNGSSLFPDTGDDLPFDFLDVLIGACQIIYLVSDKKPCDSLHKPPVGQPATVIYWLIYYYCVSLYKNKI